MINTAHTALHHGLQKENILCMNSFYLLCCLSENKSNQSYAFVFNVLIFLSDVYSLLQDLCTINVLQQLFSF